MGKAIVLKSIPENAWKKIIERLIFDINGLVFNDNNVIIEDFYDQSGNFKLRWHFEYASTSYYFLSNAIAALCWVAEVKLCRICIDCGKERFEPTPLVVRPEVCEACKTKTRIGEEHGQANCELQI